MNEKIVHHNSEDCFHHDYYSEQGLTLYITTDTIGSTVGSIKSANTTTTTTTITTTATFNL